MRIWIIRTIIMIFILVSITGFSYADTQQTTQTTVTIPDTIGITVSPTYLSFNVPTTDGQWYNDNEGQLIVQNTGNVNENILVRDNNYGYNGIYFLVNGYPINYNDYTIYSYMNPNNINYCSAQASASYYSTPGTWYDSFTWTAVAS